MDKSECFYDGCGSIKKQAMSEANKCTVEDFVKENIDGCMWLPPFREMKQDTNAVLSRAKRHGRHGRGVRRKGQEVFYRLSPFQLCSCLDIGPLFSDVLQSVARRVRKNISQSHWGSSLEIPPPLHSVRSPVADHVF